MLFYSETFFYFIKLQINEHGLCFVQRLETSRIYLPDSQLLIGFNWDSVLSVNWNGQGVFRSIKLECKRSGVFAQRVNYLKYMPPDKAILYLPWPMTEPESFRNAVRTLVPEGNPFKEFIEKNVRSQPDIYDQIRILSGISRRSLRTILALAIPPIWIIWHFLDEQTSGYNLISYGAMALLYIFFAILVVSSLQNRNKTQFHAVSQGIYTRWQIDSRLSIIPWEDILEIKAEEEQRGFYRHFSLIHKKPSGYYGTHEKTQIYKVFLLHDTWVAASAEILKFAPEGNPLREYVERNL